MAKMDFMFNPKELAVVGASNTPVKLAMLF